MIGKLFFVYVYLKVISQIIQHERKITMLSRKERVKLVRDRVSKEWTGKWWSFMMEYKGELHWYYVSSNPNITIKDIKENPDKPWDWSGISLNPNITITDITENPDKPWNWYCISQSPNITTDYIKENPDKPWDWDGISKNPFTRDKQEYQLQQYRRHLASYRIQQHWHRIRSDPYHPVGQKKLELDYNREFVFS